MKATLRNIRISPKKMNVVAELVRNMPAKKAEILLSFTPKKGAKILEKVIASAIANATNNFKQNVDELVLKEVKVSKAFTIKRVIPGSRGRTKPILKRSSHVHILLDARPIETKATKKSAKTTKSETQETEEKPKKTTKTTKK
jgi:large subunit ribosomal protein L22